MTYEERKSVDSRGHVSRSIRDESQIYQ